MCTALGLHARTGRGFATYGTPPPITKILILASLPSQPFLSQGAEGAVPKIFGEFLTAGVDATFSTSHVHARLHRRLVLEEGPRGNAVAPPATQPTSRATLTCVRKPLPSLL